MDVFYENYLGKKLDTGIEFDRLKIIDSKKDWEEYWVSDHLKSTLFINMLESYGFKFSDFLVMNLYTTIIFNRVDRKNTKSLIEDLRCLITITKKEEEELIRNGFKGSKNKKKIYKRLIKTYFTPINKNKGLVIKGSNKSELTGKDCMIIYLNAMLNLNTDEDKILDELGKATECDEEHLFVHNYLISMYKGYEHALKAIYIYGEVVSGEFKQRVQESLISSIATFVNNATNNKEGVDRCLSDLGLNVAIDLIESENAQLQNEKAFYSKRYLEAVSEIKDLEDTIKELKEELDFFRDIYKNKLRNKKILLIGDKNKETEYEEIITSFGGEMVMYDSFNDFSKINNTTLEGFDYIVHFTYYTSHSVSNKISKYSDKLLFVNSSSKVELEKVLISC